MNNKIKDFIGYSHNGLQEAINDALQNAGLPIKYEVIETKVKHTENKSTYKATVAPILD